MKTSDQLRSLFSQRREGHSLPQALYIDPDIYDFDVKAIFERTWLQAGLENEIPKAGDYLTRTVGASSILILRNEDGVIAGFFNSCRHRGAQICRESHGHAARLVCPYHQWTYDLLGQLRRAHGMHEGFDVSEYQLRPVRIETVAGLIYFCLDDNPPDFAPFRAALEPMLEPHELRKAKVVHTAKLIEKADWKLVMENARECYHCRAGHPQLLRSYRDFTERRKSAEREPWEIAFVARCEARGLVCGEIFGPWYQIGRYPLADGAQSYTMDGKAAVARPLGRVGDGDVGVMWWGVQPNNFNHVVGDYGVFFQAMPTGPQETTVTATWIVHEDAVEGVDYELERLLEVWTATNDQDRSLSENNQRGVQSVAYTPGPYSRITEGLVLRLIDWYCDLSNKFIFRR